LNEMCRGAARAGRGRLPLRAADPPHNRASAACPTILLF